MIDLGKLVVWFVTCLILYIGYTAQYVMLIHLEGWNTTSFTILGIYNILVIAVLYNYYLACTVDPGRVPANWEPEPDAPVIEVKKSNHQPRFCKSCQGYKPPRSHHCSSCERCVLKMDHHCPWLNNCVGFYNYGHFIRFIFYVDVACGLCFFILVKRTIQLFDDSYMYRNRENITNFELGLLATNLIAVVPVLLCVSMLSLFQFYGMGENTTTIEGWEKDKVANLVSKGKVAEVRFPYDVGILSNIKSVLGNNIFLWLIPQPMHGDGLSFPVTQYADEGTLIWPPPEYSKDREQSRPANPSAGGSSERFPGRRDEDGELAIPNRPLGSAYRGKAHRLNRASYSSVLDSDSESGSDHGIGISSDDSGSDFGDRDTLFAPQSRRPASYRQYLHSKIPSKPKSNSPAGSSSSRPQNPNPTLSDDDAPLAYLLPDAVELQSL